MHIANGKENDLEMMMLDKRLQKSTEDMFVRSPKGTSGCI